MTLNESESFVRQHQFGSSGWHCSGIGLGTGSNRLSDLQLGSGSEMVGPECEDWSKPWYVAAMTAGVNVFELGCVANEPETVQGRLMSLASSLGAGQPSILAIMRFSLRHLAVTPIDLEYVFRTKTVQQLVYSTARQLNPWWQKLKSLDLVGQNLKLIWVWDDIDFRNSVSRQCRQQIGELLRELRQLLPSEIGLQGIGGFRWRSLAELVGSNDVGLVLLHASGLLGPELDAGLTPICHRKGAAIVTSLPCYGGLLAQPGQLSSEHPATEAERLAAETSRIVAEEHGIELQSLAWNRSGQGFAVDCCLVEKPVSMQMRPFVETFQQDYSKRTEALVTRHLRGINRADWFES